jgi:hypothetical protein
MELFITSAHKIQSLGDSSGPFFRDPTVFSDNLGSSLKKQRRVAFTLKHVMQEEGDSLLSLAQVRGQCLSSIRSCPHS